MGFRVILSEPALADMKEIADFIWQDSPPSARRWLSACGAAVDSLSELPLRNPLITEAESLGIAYRSLPVAAHRLIYRVDEARSIVYVVRVYHGARRPLTPPDVAAS